MNQFIIYLTAGTHIESAAKHSIELSLVVIITCNVWTLQLKVKGVQYSSFEKYLFENTNICAQFIHIHQLIFYMYVKFSFPEVYLLAKAEMEAVKLYYSSTGSAAKVKVELMFPLYTMILKILCLSYFQWHQTENHWHMSWQLW